MYKYDPLYYKDVFKFNDEFSSFDDHYIKKSKEGKRMIDLKERVIYLDLPDTQIDPMMPPFINEVIKIGNVEYYVDSVEFKEKIAPHHRSARVKLVNKAITDWERPIIYTSEGFQSLSLLNSYVGGHGYKIVKK